MATKHEEGRLMHPSEGNRDLRRAALKSGLQLAVVLSAAAIASGCGGGSKAGTTTQAAASTKATKAPAASTTPTPPSSTKSAGGISGTWSGHYGGAFTGNFKLNWRQSGSTLDGSINLSAPNISSGIHGSVSGGKIRFGTVGSEAITYSGSVSGKSMSGSYKTPQGGGSWSATKSS